MNISFWVDPACPWCWMTARWTVDVVAPQRDLEISWEPMSLLWKNQPAADDPFRPVNDVVQNVILRLGDQNAILVESRPEEGLMYTFSMHPGKGSTDLTLKSSGLALLVQLARTMNQTQRNIASMDLGGQELWTKQRYTAHLQTW